MQPTLVEGFGEYFPNMIPHTHAVSDIFFGWSRFFYADERHEDGKFKGMALDGAAHGEFYSHLASHEGNVPWHATFVKGKGYVQFV
jgi:hypothetical protein